MKYIVYITINKENNKIYIGQHATDNENIFDGYIGNMVNVFNPSTIKNPKTKFQCAVKKHGFDKFHRYILATFDTLEDALLLENFLVSKTFLKREDVYNIAEGGQMINLEKEVNQFSLDGTLIESFKSIKQASEKTGINEYGISIGMRNKKSCGNYFWSADSTIDIKEYSYLGNNAKPVYMFSLNGELLKVYNSTSEAAEDADAARESIRDAIHKMTAIHKHYYSYNPEFNKIINTNRTIYQYDMNGNFMKENSVANFCEELNLDSKKLYKAANSGLTLGKYQWNINKVIKMNDKSNYSNSGIKRKVGQYDLNGNLINEFESVAECKKIYTNVRKVLNGQISTTKGYVFKYI